MGNNVFSGPFNITAAGIAAAIAANGGKLPFGDTSAVMLKNSAGALEVRTGTDSGFAALTAGVVKLDSTGVVVSSTGAVQWGSSFFGTTDLSLFRDAANVLAQRNGVNAQALRIYNTFTDASNYERVGMYWSGNKFFIESGQAAGTGTARDLGLLGGGTSLDVLANGINMYRNGTSNSTLFNASGTSLTSTTQLFFRLTPTINQASGTYTVLDINPTETAIGAGPHYFARARLGAGGNLWGIRNTGHVELGKLTDPAAPAANFGLLYMKDNGGGKMQIVARFPTGAVQVIATEP